MSVGFRLGVVMACYVTASLIGLSQFEDPDNSLLAFIMVCCITSLAWDAISRYIP